MELIGELKAARNRLLPLQTESEENYNKSKAKHKNGRKREEQAIAQTDVAIPPGIAGNQAIENENTQKTDDAERAVPAQKTEQAGLRQYYVGCLHDEDLFGRNQDLPTKRRSPVPLAKGVGSDGKRIPKDDLPGDEAWQHAQQGAPCVS